MNKGADFNQIADKIIKEKIPCFFISPHMDDAILSAGDLISYLSDKTHVEVINVFSKPSKRPYSLSARAFLRQCGYNDADDLFRDRILEDKEVLSKIGIKPQYLDLVDATWRKKKDFGLWSRLLGKFIGEFNNVYPVFRLHIKNGRVSPKDSDTKLELAKKLKEIIPDNAYVFCPLAYNSHVDHALVKEVCIENFPHNIILWSDFPYNVQRIGNEKLDDSVNPYVLKWQNNQALKTELIKGYESQYLPLFKNSRVNLVPEGYYIPKSSELIKLPLQKPSILIGIPAYNEADNISHLLSSLLKQELTTCRLEKIIVISDASTDDTAEMVRSIKDDRIQLIENKERKGAYSAQNDLISMADCDIMVILNADIMPFNASFLEELVSPLTQNPEVALTAPYIIPAKPRTFIEKILVNSHELKSRWYLDIKKGNNLYMCPGVARAFSREFIKTLKWPIDVPEDAYSYLACINSGFRFSFAKKSVAIFRAPSTWGDHLKQSKRFFAGKKKMYNFFRSDVVKREYHITLYIRLKHTILQALRRPVLTISYMLIANYIKLFHPKSYQSKWEISLSTKERIRPEDGTAI